MGHIISVAEIASSFMILSPVSCQRWETLMTFHTFPERVSYLLVVDHQVTLSGNHTDKAFRSMEPCRKEGYHSWRRLNGWQGYTVIILKAEVEARAEDLHAAVEEPPRHWIELQLTMPRT